MRRNKAREELKNHVLSRGKCKCKEPEAIKSFLCSRVPVWLECCEQGGWPMMQLKR